MPPTSFAFRSPCTSCGLRSPLLDPAYGLPPARHRLVHASADWRYAGWAQPTAYFEKYPNLPVVMTEEYAGLARLRDAVLRPPLQPEPAAPLGIDDVMGRRKIDTTPSYT